MDKDGPIEGLAGPVRMCVGCRVRDSRSVLLRVVVRDSRLVPDSQARLPGRGAWLHRDLHCLEAAERRRAFPRALKVQGPLEVTAVRDELSVNQTSAGTLPGDEGMSKR